MTQLSTLSRTVTLKFLLHSALVNYVFFFPNGCILRLMNKKDIFFMQRDSNYH